MWLRNVLRNDELNVKLWCQLRPKTVQLDSNGVEEIYHTFLIAVGKGTRRITLVIFVNFL